jgi:hypothetical protein
MPPPSPPRDMSEKLGAQKFNVNVVKVIVQFIFDSCWYTVAPRAAYLLGSLFLFLPVKPIEWTL